MKFLILDDEVISINGIRKGINWDTLDCDEIYTAVSAEQAREILRQQDVDILLCDVEMPGEDGISLVSWMRSQKISCECIFLTCHDEFQYVKKALQLQSVDYVLKPIPYDELQQILQNTVIRILQKRRENQILEFGKSRLQMDQESFREESLDAREVVNQTTDYINTCFSEDISIEALARRVHVSEAYLSRIFRRYTGKSIIEYLTEKRMFYAAELLRDPKISVGKAAVESGYNNYPYFTQVFKKTYGVSPSQYQREHKT